MLKKLKSFIKFLGSLLSNKPIIVSWDSKTGEITEEERTDFRTYTLMCELNDFAKSKQINLTKEQRRIAKSIYLLTGKSDKEIKDIFIATTLVSDFIKSKKRMPSLDLNVISMKLTGILTLLTAITFVLVRILLIINP